jgi:hypothetical protein
MWKVIDEIDGYKIKKDKYQINDKGKIRNKRTKKKYAIIDNGIGYLSVNLKLENGDWRMFYIHRIVYSTFISSDIIGKVVHHKNTDRSCNKVGNLDICTQKENIEFSIKLGTINNKGQNNSTAILTDDIVHIICKKLEKGKSIKKICNKLELDYKKYKDIISKISSGKNWIHISSLYNIRYNKRKSMNSHAKYIDDVCYLISNGTDNFKDIAKELNIDISSKNEYQKFFNFIKRIKNKKSYKDISDKYFK